MKRLAETIDRARAEDRGIFMPFIVVGDPDFDTSERIAQTLIDEGADILEVGFAFSDPPADGPVIQLADQRALAAGATVARSFDMLAGLRERTDVPFTLLMYYNLILQFGVDAFYQRASEVGVDAVLVADLPIEEADQVLAAAHAHHVAPIFIVSELTSEARLARLRPHARGYLYLVAHLGVTGTRDEVGRDLAATIARLRPHTDLPLFAGFGIATPSHVRQVLDAGADGAIVGSALVREIEANLGDPDAIVQAVGALARSLSGAKR